ncbi:MAG: 50S ribosomal protein L29 [Crenarchaeota archaeon]|nr:50S ribosomal protein L29 [Thermoproteota archaeon]MDW8033821.1 50S ribosomal protein L29 [Nitrososphaerota archaeon]
MARLKASEIRSMSREERLKKLQELRNELMIAKMRAASGLEENTKAVRELKRAIARILTVEREENRK